MNKVASVMHKHLTHLNYRNLIARESIDKTLSREKQFRKCNKNRKIELTQI